MNLYLVVLICTISLASCTKSSDKGHQLEVNNESIADTTYVSNPNTCIIVFKHPELNNGLCSKEFYPSGKVIKEVFVMNVVPPTISILNEYKTSSNKELDSVVEYYDNGTLKSIVFELESAEYIGPQTYYDSIGNLDRIEEYDYDRNVMNRTYYTNKKIVAIQVDSLYLPLRYVWYDSLGTMVGSQINRFVLDTVNGGYMFLSTEYEYEHGRVVNITHNKSFEESLPCPCGKWIYYNKKGKIIKVIKYPDCNNFNTDYCDSLEDLEKEKEGKENGE